MNVTDPFLPMFANWPDGVLAHCLFEIDPLSNRQGGDIFMKNQHRYAAVFWVVVLTGMLLRCTPAAGAAATGQIVGTIKLDGPAPSRRPIDMSKDPGCAQTRSGAAAAENVVVGPDGGLANVVVYISQGLSGDRAGVFTPVKLEQKGCQICSACSGGESRPTDVGSER